MNLGLPAAVSNRQRAVSRRLDRLSEGRFAVVAVAPGLVLVGLLVVPPLLAAVWLSLWRIDLLKDGITPFIALRNYMIRLPADTAFLGTLPVTVAFAAVTTAIAVPIALGAALLINSQRRFRGVLTLLLLLPWAISPVADATLWALLVQSPRSPVNGLLHAAGLPPIVLGEAPGAFLVMILAVTWRAVPLLGILFLGALRQVPPHLPRAARLDGASSFQALRYVVLPAIAPTLILACLIQIILSLQVFDIQYAMFGDTPPAGATLSAFAIFEAVNKGFRLGYGAAMTVVLGAVIGLCLLAFYALFGRRRAAPPDPVDDGPRPGPAAWHAIANGPARPPGLVARPAAPAEPARPNVARRWLSAARRSAARHSRPVAAIALVLWLVGPVIWIVLASTQKDSNLLATPLRLDLTTVELRGYRTIIADAEWRSALWNTIVIATCATALAFSVAILAAYPLARYRLRGSRTLVAFLAGTQLIPPIALAIPLLFLFLRLDLRNTLPGLVVINAAFWAPILVLLLRSVFVGVPASIELAARMDGLSRLGVIFRITLRVAAPAVAAVIAIVFVGIWNDFVFVAVLGGPDTFTVTRYLGQSDIPSYNVLAASVVLAVAPCLLLVALARRQILRLDVADDAPAADTADETGGHSGLRRLTVSRRRALFAVAAAGWIVAILVLAIRPPGQPAVSTPFPTAVIRTAQPAASGPGVVPTPRPSPTPKTSRASRLAAIVVGQGITDVTPGCAVAISQGGSLVYESGFGLADMDTKTPITPDTAFDVASVSKQFTAAAILLLAQEGRLSLRDDIRHSIPELPEYRRVVHIDELMYHTSGMVDLIDAIYRAGFSSSDRVTADDALKAIAAADDLHSGSGTTFSYNSTGYFLMKVVVERVTGQRFQDFVQARIFGPLGMTSSYFDDRSGPYRPGHAAAYSIGLTRSGVTYPPLDFSWDVVGGAGLQTTVRDLLKWADNFRTHRVGGDAFVRSQLVIGATSAIEDYAGGLRVRQHDGRQFFLHGGGWSQAGFRSGLLMDLAGGVAVALTCNLAGIDPYRLGFDIYDAWTAGS